MDAMKRVMIDALELLKKADFKKFTWQLENRVTEGIDRIPAAKLEKADRLDVADLMGQYYSTDAGNIAVKALRNINQKDLANELEQKLQKVQQPEQVDGGKAVRQSDWKRPERVIPCTQASKDRILRENRNNVYIPMKRSLRKGSALLITNIRNRAGAEEDEENMEWLLKALGYSVEKHTNLSGEEMDAAVKNFAARTDHKDADSTFVAIMSHGKRIRNKDAILGVDYTGPKDFFFVDDIFSHLNSVNCPALIDKPKVILIQACRGSLPGGVEISDGASESDSLVHREKDFACFMSSLPDIVAYRNPAKGSYFIMHILDVFCEWAHNDHIIDLFIKVSKCMAEHPGREEKKLLPSIERTTILDKFFLFPGL